MDAFLNKINHAFDYAIRSNYAIFDSEAKIKQRIRTAKNVCIYGAGGFFEGYHGYLERFDYVCDSNKNKWGTLIFGKKCISIDEMLKLEDLVVIIMLGNYQDTLKWLQEQQVEHYLFTEVFLNVYTEKKDSVWFEIERKEAIRALNMFEDNTSKETFTEIICNRIAPMYAEKTFHELENSNEYFNSGIFKCSDNETFIDAGAYNGDSTEAFIKNVGQRFKKIWAFELDEKNYKDMCKNLLPYKKTGDIELLNMGVSDFNDEIPYISEETGSRAVQTSSNVAKVCKLDDVIQEQQVTFIKMDIEGFELSALKGAINIINENQPKLVISAYHRLEDLWKVPLYIKGINERYKVYLRHHSPMVWDTDCYAV